MQTSVRHSSPADPVSAADDPAVKQRYQATLEEALSTAKALCGAQGVWVFGYGSLIWRRPEFEAVEQRKAQVIGWHRALRMRSRVNRGCAEQPGLVFALLRGGACSGVAYRLSPTRCCDDLTRLWAREMPLAVYEPRWLRCRTQEGEVKALAFTLNRAHPSHTGPIDDAQMLNILRCARGRYGTTLEYLIETHRGLQAAGIRDSEVERLVQLACREGLSASAA